MTYKHSRTTKHNKPRFQFRWFGFNAENSCWIGPTNGEWVDVPSEAVFLADRDAHEALMVQSEAERRAGMKTQRHNGDPTPVESMTPAQRAAWNHFSGFMNVAVRVDPAFKAKEDFHLLPGQVGHVSIEMSGDRLGGASLRFLRNNGLWIIRWVKHGYTGSITDTLATLSGVPDDLIDPDVGTDEASAVDPWAAIVQRNMVRQKEHAVGLAGHHVRGAGGPWGQMAVAGLVRMEEGIVRSKWKAASGGDLDPYTFPDLARDLYVEARREIANTLGDDFDPLYASVKDRRNATARSSLDLSGGSMFSFVLPVFHEDGSHEAWGDRDVPWNP